MSAETLKLRVVPITFCPPAQNRLREQCLTPQGNQALRIKVARMDCPKAH
jgi:hypothetical protein